MSYYDLDTSTMTEDEFYEASIAQIISDLMDFHNFPYHSNPRGIAEVIYGQVYANHHSGGMSAIQASLCEYTHKAAEILTAYQRLLTQSRGC